MATYYEEEKKKSGFLGKLVAVILGFLFGIIATIGSLAAIGYYVYAKMRIRDGFELVGNFVGDIDYTQYITDEYADKTVSELVGELQGLVSSLSDKSLTLADLNKISPQVETQVTKLADSLEANYNIPVEINSRNKDTNGNILDEKGAVIIDKDGNVEKTDENGRAVLTAENGEMLVGIMDLPFSLLSDFVMGTVRPLELGAVLSSPSLNMLAGNDMLMLLCYGDESNYEIVDGEVVMKNGARATTIGDLLGSGSGTDGEGGITSVLDNISLAGLLEVTSDGFDDSDPVVRALVYGTEGKNYIYDEDAGEPVWLPLSYALNSAENTFTSPDGTEYLYDETSGEWQSEDGGSIRPASGAVRAVSASADASYDYLVYDAAGELVCGLKRTEDGSFAAYSPDGEQLYHGPRTLGDLMNSLGGADGNVVDLLSDVELGVLLGISDQKYGEDNKMLFALAYGNIGTDFLPDENGGVIMLNGAEPTTVGDLTGGDAQALFDEIALDSLMNISRTDNVMCALAYGTEGIHYTWAEGEESPEMLPVRYTVREGGLVDETGNPVEAVLENGVWTIVSESGTLYGREEDGGVYVYDAPDGTERVLYSKTTLGDLFDGPEALMNDIRLGSLMGLNGSSDPTLLALAYGTEGVDYEIDEATNEIVPLEGGKAPVTVGDLTNDETAAEIFNGLQLGSVLGISPLDLYDDDPDNDPDPVMLSLAYGEEGTHYIVTDADGVYSVEWLTDPETNEPYGPRTIADLKDGGFIDELQLASVLNVSPLDEDSDALMTALAYGNEGEHYRIVTDENGSRRIEWLLDPETNEPYGPRTIADLRDGSAALDELWLSTVLDVTAQSDGIMLSLAYGNEGEDYEIVDGEIVMLNGAKPRSIGELKDGGLIDGVRLSAIVTADPDDAITMYVLYGVEGVHYETDADTGAVVMLRREIAVYGGNAYDERGDLLPGTLQETDDGYIYTDGETVWLLEERSGKTTEIETDGETVEAPCYYAADETGGAVYYAPRTIGDFSGESSLLSDITKDLTIGDLMGEGEQSGLIAAVSDWKIDDLNDQDKIMSLKIGDVMQIDETSTGILRAMADWSLGDLNNQNKIMSLKISDVMEIDGTSPVVLQTMLEKDWTLADLNDKDTFESLTLAEVIEIDETNPDTPDLLISLRDAEIGALGDAVNSLKLTQMLGEDDVQNNRFLRHLADSTVLTLADDLSDLSIAEVFADDVYTTDGDAKVLTGTWKYLLTDPEGVMAPEDYTINDIGLLTQNMTTNIQNANLETLHGDGIISMEDTAFLQSDIIYSTELLPGLNIPAYSNPDGTDKSKIGQLTITELIDYVGKFLTYLSSASEQQ